MALNSCSSNLCLWETRVTLIHPQVCQYIKCKDKLRSITLFLSHRSGDVTGVQHRGSVLSACGSHAVASQGAESPLLPGSPCRQVYSLKDSSGTEEEVGHGACSELELASPDV